MYVEEQSTESPYEIQIFDAATLELITANAIACRNLGYEPRELVGLGVADIIPEFSKESFSLLTKGLRQGNQQCVRITAMQRRKDRSEYLSKVEVYLSEYEGKQVFMDLCIPLKRRVDLPPGVQPGHFSNMDMLDAVPCAIFTVDTAQRITSWGPQMEKMTGLETADVMDKKCTHVWNCLECRDGCKLFASEVKKPIYNRQYHVEMAGRSLVLNNSADLLRNSDGKVIGGIEVCQDITQVKTVLDELVRSNSAQKALNELLSISLEDIDMEQMGRRFIEKIVSIPWLGVEPKGVLFVAKENEDILELKGRYNLDPELETLCREVPFGCCICGKVASSAEPLYKDSIDDDHDRKYINMTEHGHYCVPIIASNHIVRGVLNLHLKHKASIDEEQVEFLQSAADIIAVAIERELAQRKLLAAHEQLKESDKLKSDFIITVTHELRTPLTIFKNIISNSMSNLYGRISPKLRRHLEVADDMINRLARVISDVVEISEIDSGSKSAVSEKININEVVGTVVEMMAPTAEAKGLVLKSVRPEGSIYVMAMRRDIEKVLTHLVENAIRFVPEIGGQILIRVRDLVDEVEIDVEDNGRGIAANDVERVFNRFVQVTKQTGPGSHGIGLGLAVCKELVSTYKGRIWIEGNSDKGANFCFALPKCKDDAKAEEAFDENTAGELEPQESLEL